MILCERKGHNLLTFLLMRNSPEDREAPGAPAGPRRPGGSLTCGTPRV